MSLFCLSALPRAEKLTNDFAKQEHAGLAGHLVGF